MIRKPLQSVCLLLCLTSPVVVQAQSAVVDALRNGDRQAALEMIKSGVDVNTLHGDGSTALLWASYRLDHEMVDLLLSHEADPDISNNYGARPLDEAVKAADVALTRMLLEAGAQPDLSNDDGQTPLMLAARTGNMEIARLLVEHGAEIDAREDWRQQTALMWAAANRQAEMTRFLIDQGAQVDIRARTFDWPSQITAEPRAQYRPTGGLTPLLYAARTGCIDCMAAIVDAGADINRPNPDGITPLMVAIDNYRFDSAAWLLEQGANPHLWDWWGRTALYVAADVNSYRPNDASLDPNEVHSGLDIMRKLLVAGVEPNARLNMHRPGRGGNSGRFTDDMLTTGATPLLRAAYSADLTAVELLLEHGALVDLPNVMGVTPFMVAAGFGHDRGALIRGFYSAGYEERMLPVLETLLEAGADINKRIEDTTSYTARIARLSSMSDRQGQTALFAAAKQNWLQVSEWLLANGADPTIHDDLGKSVLDAAKGQAGGRVDRPNEAMVAFLEDYLAEQK